MADATTQRDTLRLISPDDAKFALPVAASQVIPKGTMVGVNTSGLAVRGGGASAGFSCAIVGRACTNSDNLAAQTLIEFESGIFGWAIGGTVDQTTVGQIVFAADNQTITDVDTNVVAGVLVSIRDGVAYVKSGFFNYAVPPSGGGGGD